MEATRADLVPYRMPRYAGLVTRVLAFVIDAAIINVVALVVAGAIGLALSIFDIKGTGLVLAGSASLVVWSIGYFVTFWSTTGQTPGDSIMRIRVIHAQSGKPLKPRRSLVRFFAMLLAALPFCAGFLPILYNPRRRGFHDRVANTVVEHVPDPVSTHPHHGPPRTQRTQRVD